MNILLSLLGAVVSVPLALSNPVPLENSPIAVETSIETVAAKESVATSQETEPEVTFAAIKEVVQEFPDYSKPWLDGRVSFIGGELTSSRRQLAYAEANYIPFMRTEVEYWKNVRSGHFVALSHPGLEIGTWVERPYVLPSTAEFIYGVADKLRAASCRKLRVNDATRLTGIQPSNASKFSVHAAGMALDLRVKNLSPPCYDLLSNLLSEGEAAGLADSTREYWKIVRGRKMANDHFHVVVMNKKKQDTGRVYFNSTN